MEKSMISACGSCGQVVSLDQKYLEASKRAISGCSGSCDTSSDNDHIKFIVFSYFYHIVTELIMSIILLLFLSL